MYACKNSKPRGLEELLKRELLKTDRKIDVALHKTSLTSTYDNMQTVSNINRR